MLLSAAYAVILNDSILFEILHDFRYSLELASILLYLTMKDCRTDAASAIYYGMQMRFTVTC